MNDQNGLPQQHLIRTKDTLWTSGGKRLQNGNLTKVFPFPATNGLNFQSILLGPKKYFNTGKPFPKVELLRDATIASDIEFQQRNTIPDAMDEGQCYKKYFPIMKMRI